MGLNGPERWGRVEEVGNTVFTGMDSHTPLDETDRSFSNHVRFRLAVCQDDA